MSIIPFLSLISRMPERQCMKGLLAALFFSTSLAFAQNSEQIDSLQRKLESAHSDTVKIGLMNEIARAYITSNPDTAIVLALKARNKAVDARYRTGQAEAIRISGIAFDNKGEFSKALENFSRARDLFLQARNFSGVARCYNDIGVILYEQSRYDSALNCL